MCCLLEVYSVNCDTCDSKKTKTPGYARMRVRAMNVIIGIFTIVKCPSPMNAFR